MEYIIGMFAAGTLTFVLMRAIVWVFEPSEEHDDDDFDDFFPD